MTVEPAFVDVEPDDPRLTAELFPVLRELRTELTPERLVSIYAEGWTQGLRFTALYADGACTTVAGWRIVANTFTGRKLYVDDLVTRADARSGGCGQAMLAELDRRARVAGCDVLDLDSGVQRADAHRFYMREGMPITAFHFTLRLV